MNVREVTYSGNIYVNRQKILEYTVFVYSNIFSFKRNELIVSIESLN